MFLVVFLGVVASFLELDFGCFLKHAPVVKHVLLFSLHLDAPVSFYSLPLVPDDLIDFITIFFLLSETALSTHVMLQNFLPQLVTVGQLLQFLPLGVVLEVVDPRGLDWFNMREG